jgi:hypothetical protein
MAISPPGGTGRSVAAGGAEAVGVLVGGISVAVGTAITVITAVDPPAGVCGARVQDNNSKVATIRATPNPIAPNTNQGSVKNPIIFRNSTNAHPKTLIYQEESQRQDEVNG